MTSWETYVPNSSSFHNLDEKRHKKFYRLQKGSGPAIKIVSPTQDTVERARLDLKRQIEDQGLVGPGINSNPKTNMRQKRKRRGRVQRKKPTKRAGKAKGQKGRGRRKATGVCKSVKKGRKFARKQKK